MPTAAPATPPRCRFCGIDPATHRLAGAPAVCDHCLEDVRCTLCQGDGLALGLRDIACPACGGSGHRELDEDGHCIYRGLAYCDNRKCLDCRERAIESAEERHQGLSLELHRGAL